MIRRLRHNTRGTAPARPSAPGAAALSPWSKVSGTGSVDLKALADRMVWPALNEAVACVREKIVADEDLCDAGVIFGTGFAPNRGGPIATIRARGKAEWLKVAAEKKAKYGLRFEPDTGWDTL